MKPRLKTLLCTILTSTILFSSCASVQDNKSKENRTGDTTTSIAQTTVSETTTNEANPSSYSASINQDWKGYKGYTYPTRYVYRYSDERNRHWEDIVLKFANDFLNPARGYVYFLDREDAHAHIGSNIAYTNVLKNAFDKERYQYFIPHVENLISQIHEKSDLELGYAIVSIINGLSESHTTCSPILTKSYCLDFITLANHGTNKIYCLSAQKENKDLLGNELVAINDIRIEEVLDRLIPYARGYDDQSRRTALTKLTSASPLLYSWDLLEMLGIVEGGVATFTFSDANGIQKNVSISAVTLEEHGEFYTSQESPYLYPEEPFLMDSVEEQIWYKQLDNDIVYIRILSFRDLEENNPKYVELLDYLSEKRKANKIILDLRDNRGGHRNIFQKLFVALREFDAPQKYIFVDTLTNSASIVMSYLLRNHLEEPFLIVGTPCWNTNFAYNPEVHEADIPNFGKLEYRIPKGAYYLSEDGGLLQPDVPLNWEYEDYINGRDTLLEWVKKQ